ncbi:NAD(P)-dependent oxidoreductase [Streptomyces noursei]|uniref:NAD(P)-dependent oxidoreductase n=1 Tax=Streptomyces noursei TaxID=1971 RepID=UPI0033DF116E
MTHTNGSFHTYDVAVIGCGLMGSALARTLAANGHTVTAWNRTPHRAHALAGESITPALSIRAAVRSSRLVIACLSTYEATVQVLEPVTDWHGTTLTVLGSGTPDQAQQTQHWAEGRGATYLDGVILGHPGDIGTPGAVILYSGPPDTWTEHEPTLKTLAGASRLISQQTPDANRVDAGLSAGFFITALAAFTEAATYVLKSGIPVTVVDELTELALEILRSEAKTTTAAITTGKHETDQATLTTHAEGARVALAALRESGYPARILAAAIDNMTAAEQAGLGHLGFSAQAETLGSAMPDKTPDGTRDD